MTSTTSIILKKRPTSTPTTDNFHHLNRVLPALKEGELLVKSLYISVDPYIRGRLYTWPINSIITSPQIAQVIKVNKPLKKLQPGDIIFGTLEWSKPYSIVNSKNCRKIAEDWKTNPNLCLSNYLGILGGTGMTAYYGLLEIGALEYGENVFVSAAAGATGSVVGQIAKHIKECYVVGTAGSNQKCNWLTNDLGYDIALNYKDYGNDKRKFRTALRKVFPNGIDVYFDNTGGFQTEAIWDLLNRHARVVVCGQIANYNRFYKMPQIDDFLGKTIYKNIRIEGFVVGDFRKPKQFHKNMVRWISNGKLKSRQTVYDGFDKTIDAFIGLFSGENIGKAVVKVDDPENINNIQYPKSKL